MKKVLSVSIGSSKRDHRAEITFLDQDFVLERRGTDGDMDKAISMIRELDGKIDAFGMGGIDIWIWGGKRRYTYREGKRIAASAQKTPIVDGSGLKNTLERRVIYQVLEREPSLLQGKNVLMVSAMDRFGMSEALLDAGCKTLYGDFIFALGLPIPLYRLRILYNVIAPVVAPVAVKLPFKMIYPMGEKQEETYPDHSFTKYYRWADVIAGDWHMIKKYLPWRVEGKVFITNTVTQADVELLRSRGAELLITTTPEVHGRSFGTNVMEAMLVAYMEKPLAEIQPEDYIELMEKAGFQPRFVQLN